MKVCKVCKQEKSISDFYKDGHGYLETTCKSCRIKETTLWNKSNKEKHNKWVAEYKQSSRGKSSHRKTNNRRKRKFGYVEFMNNPFPEEIQIEYHHINNLIVIPIPQTTHKKTLGKKHREKMNKIIEKYYGLDFHKLLQQE